MHRSAIHSEDLAAYGFGGSLALVVLVAHRVDATADRWVEWLERCGHLARRVDPVQPGARPSALDALLVDASLPASAVADLRRWAGPQVVVRLADDEPDEGWLRDLVRGAAVPVRLGPVEVDARRGVVVRDGEIVSLTDTEALLLAWLATQAGTVVSRGELLQRVWGYQPTMRTRVVDVTMGRLRSKIEPDPSDPRFLITVRGEGYRLDGLTAPVAETAPPAHGLVGRDDVWQMLQDWFGRTDPLLTLLGPPGIGKTALASAFAATVGGAVWCSLQAAQSDDDAVAAVASALGLPAGAPEAQVVAAVQEGERPLLVIDNAEQVAGLVGRLVADAPASPVLVTSRVRLASPHERPLDLAPLPPDDTEALFLARARQRRADFEAEPDTLRELGRLCEGLPLAVELAAAQVGVLSGPELVAVLSRRGVRDRDRAGHRTYDEALTSSLALLDDDARRLLSILAALRRSVPVALLDHVLEEPLEPLSDLVDASLAKIEHSVGGASVHLLETVRRHVTGALPLPPDAARATVNGVLRFAEAVRARGRTAGGWSAIQEAGRMRGAVQEAVALALAAGDEDTAARLALSLTDYFGVSGTDATDLAMLRRLRIEPGAPRAFEVAVLLALILRVRGSASEGERLVRYCVDQARTDEQRALAAHVEVLHGVRVATYEPGRLEPHMDAFSDPVDESRAAGALGLVYKLTGDLDTSVRWFERALAIADRLGAPWLQTGHLAVLASVHAQRGEWDRAGRFASDVVDALQQSGDRRNDEMLLALRRTAHQARGEIAQAIDDQRELVALMKSQGRPYHHAHMLRMLAELLVDAGRPDEVLGTCDQLERAFRALGDDATLGEVEVTRAEAELALDRVEAALARAEAQFGAPNRNTRVRAVHVAVIASLTLGDPDRAAAAIDDVGRDWEVSALHRALVAAHREQPVELPDRAVSATSYREALWGFLGAPHPPPRTPRGEAILAGAPEDAGRFPESALVRALHARRP